MTFLLYIRDNVVIMQHNLIKERHRRFVALFIHIV